MVNNINSKLAGKKQIDSDCGAGKTSVRIIAGLASKKIRV